MGNGGDYVVEIRQLREEIRLLRHQDDSKESTMKRIPITLFRKDSGVINRVVDKWFRGED